ncbi:MAG: response regulator [Treponema sp.]|jgi:signal transduction histidine kinase/FixJ family two-component response regulator/HPt (histidine-containing phosphotransfer) domain-containing protein|nr:response regulator [Treponema sp.]
MEKLSASRAGKPLAPWLLLGVLALVFFWGCAAARRDDQENRLYIDLNEYPLYAKSGFTLTLVTELPALRDAPWRTRMPGKRRGSAYIDTLDLPDTPRRFFLSPVKEKVGEYTMLIPFTLNPEQFARINGNEPFQPGLFLDSLGDNWEIFLNGSLIKSELHLDDEGQIRSGRAWRYIAFPLDKACFVPGTNLLGFRIIGMPHADITGMWSEGPYYIGDYEAIRKDHDESVKLFACGAYLLVGIYHFLIFLFRPRYRDNLYHSIFAVFLALYFLMRNNAIYRFIPNTDVTFRLEYIGLYLLMPMLSAFLEHLDFRKTTKISRVFIGLCLLCAVLQAVLPNPFGDDILRVWWALALLALVYIVGYDILYVFLRDIRSRRKADANGSLASAFWASLVKTPLGNVVAGVFVICITACIDVISSITSGYGIINASYYGLFVFTMTTAIILAQRFGGTFRRLDEANLLLEKSNLNLEATVRERTRELEWQTELATSASLAKSAFLARMSHEIRTPLNVILGLSEVELQDYLPDKTRLNLEKINHSGSLLLEIVNDILDISKIESGNFEINPAEYEFSGLVNDAIQLNILRIGSKRIEFRLELDETIPSKLYGDELRIKQILNNLLSNAFKYTEEGEVRLLVNWEQRGADAQVLFAVEDTGRGIKQEDVGKLFSDYIQLDAAANRRIEGTGLGLSITKGLVEMMGGTITVESEYGKGSVFRVSLPQGIVDPMAVGRETADNLKRFWFSDDRTRRGSIVRSWMPYGKVLVVDDLQTNLDVMTGLLMPYGLKVDTALCGQDAVEGIRAGEPRYDLIFMDHMMPGMDGVEAVRIIRNGIDSEYARNVPIIVLTANAVAGNREMFLASGFNDFIAKPIDIKQLDMALNQWVRDTQSEETLREAEQEARERGAALKPEAAGTGGSVDEESRWLLKRRVGGVDFPAALTLYGNSGATLMSILKSFVANTPALVEKLDSYVELSPEEYGVEAHGLKGTCAAICAGEAAELAKQQEFAAKEGKAELVKARHGELRRKALELTESLKALLAEWEALLPAQEKEARDEPDGELLARLSGATGEFNSNATEAALEELERYRYTRGGELVQWLREQAENFDYDAMHKRLEALLGGKTYG